MGQTTGKRFASVNFEEKVRNATISDRTREYLAVYGKLVDAETQLCALVGQEYGENQTDRILAECRDYMTKVYSEVEKHVVWSITENINTVDCNQI